MKTTHKSLTLFVLLQTAAISACADTSPAAELGQMMKRMYAYSIHEFEYGRAPATNRYNATRNCTMLRSFFDAPMLTEERGVEKCAFDHSRFAPDFDGTPMEEVVTADGMNLPPPIPFIQSIKVSGEQAHVDLLFGAADAPKGILPNARLNQGRVVFFLKKMSQGWRIVNKLSFKKWPLDLAGERSNCMMASSDFQFALAPRIASDLAWLPPACQKLMLSDLPK